MIEIQLSKGKVAVIDDIDSHLIDKHKWHAKIRPSCCYAATNIWNGIQYRSVFMHRLILNAPAKAVIDHIDGDGLNNTRANIRICSQAENMRNRRPHGTASQYLGVACDREASGRPWTATIGIKKIGRFLTELDAARAYDREAVTQYGEFARPNFPTILCRSAPELRLAAVKIINLMDSYGSPVNRHAAAFMEEILADVLTTHPDWQKKASEV